MIERMSNSFLATGMSERNESKRKQNWQFRLAVRQGID